MVRTRINRGCIATLANSICDVTQNDALVISPPGTEGSTSSSVARVIKNVIAIIMASLLSDRDLSWRTKEPIRARPIVDCPRNN